MSRSIRISSLVVVLGLALVAFAQQQFQQPGGKAAGKKVDGLKKASKVKLVARLAGFKEWVTSVAVSPDGKEFAAGSYGVIRRWKTGNRKTLSPTKLRNGFVRDLAYSPDGKWLAAGGYQRTFVGETATGKLVRSLKGQRGQADSYTHLRAHET